MMIESLEWLALEVKYLDRAKDFYQKHLNLSVERENENEAVFECGDSNFVVRAPSDVPRGGVHTHFAFSTPREEYDRWYDELSETFDLEERDFGSYTSLYFYDPDGHCVEIGQSDEGGKKGITGIFEIVLEVEDIDRAEKFYSSLGMEPYDYGDERERIRLDADVADFELWEPQLGIADAQGGVHVDVGFGVENTDEVVEVCSDLADSVEEFDKDGRKGVRIRDEDGHYLTFLGPGSS